ncbi:unnamed protein product [Thlaspi arvense]|uniref:Uncharacterized protein n=1 Tax=Thlaspi arvense TaxID=13288 RepID=A0AAU9SQG6_THLAR|nr:unnamed protein product [Thlaspi arvense]
MSDNVDVDFAIYHSGKFLILDGITFSYDGGETFNDEHSCISDGYNKVLKGMVIAKMLLNDIRRNPTMKPKAMQAAIEEKYN